MRKSFSLILACGLYINALSQIEVSDKTSKTSEKWTITPNKLKSSTGRLVIGNPKGTIWTIYIYRASDNKYITSFAESNSKGIFTLTPGEYRITLNNAPVENVVIKKGHDTKLNIGILEVIENDVWYLYDEQKIKSYTSGIKPVNLLLPVGNYIIESDGNQKQVLVKGKDPGQIHDNPSVDAEKYTMTPLPEKGNINNENTGKGKGLLGLLPKHSAFAFPLYMIVKVIKIDPTGGESQVFECSYKLPGSQHCFENVSLPVGNYKIQIGAHRSFGDMSQGYYCDGACPEVVINDIPIREGYETKLKYGYLNATNPGVYVILNEGSYNGCHHFYASTKIPYPVGKYRVKHLFVGEFPVEIRQGETVDLETMIPSSIPNPKWDARAWLPSATKGSLTGMGKLNCSFTDPSGWNINYAIDKLVLLTPKPNDTSQYTYTNLDTLKSIDLKEGRYRLNLNGIFEEIVIKDKKETRLRFGYLKIKINEGWSLRPLNAANSSPATGAGSKTIAIPVGYYNLEVGFYRFLVKIDEGAMVEIDFPGIFCF